MDRQNLLREAEASITMDVRSGFYSRQQIITRGQAQFLNDARNRAWLSDEVLREMTDRAITRQLQAQRGWPPHTDCDSLDAAFAALEREGIVARHDYACCQGCGHAELKGEMAQGRGDVQGYVFYPHQDTEKALAGYGLMLSYGVLEGDERAQIKVGQRIVFALRDAGLATAWSGSPYERIYIRNFKWQRRFPMREAA